MREDGSTGSTEVSLMAALEIYFTFYLYINTFIFGLDVNVSFIWKMWVDMLCAMSTLCFSLIDCYARSIGKPIKMAAVRD